MESAPKTEEKTTSPRKDQSAGEGAKSPRKEKKEKKKDKGEKKEKAGKFNAP